MHRLFVAIRPPPLVRAQLLGLMDGVPDARWQDDEQLHLTLRFIGEVERPLAEDIALALARVRQPQFSIALAGVGSFARKGRTDALWAGVTPRDALTELHKRIDQALIRLGLPPEGRAYLPHITLARFARSVGADIDPFALANAALAIPPFAVTHFALLESRLGGEGARYETVARYALG